MSINRKTSFLLMSIFYFWGMPSINISANEVRKFNFDDLDSTSVSMETSKVRNHRVGFQLNPHPDGVVDLVNGIYLTVWALRYGYQIQPKIMIGPEISGVDYRNNFSYDQTSFINSGFFVRYEVYRVRKFGFAAEFSPYLEYLKVSYRTDFVNNSGYHEDDDYRFRYFVAPVINYGNPNAFFSFDFMWKFSHLEMPSGFKSIPSIRFNFNF